MKKKKRAAKPEAENPDGFLGISGKTWLIVGGVAVAALLAWKVYQARKAKGAENSALPGPGWTPSGAAAAPSAGVAGVAGASGVGAAQPCPATPQPGAESGPDDEFGGGELL